MNGTPAIRCCAAALLFLAALAGPLNSRAEAASVAGLSDDRARVEQLREDGAHYEHGEGVPKDAVRAVALYCEAARLGDAASQFDLGWLYANGRGVERNDGWAAYFFNAAAEQGIEQARRMLAVVGDPSPTLPDCMRSPAESEPVALPPPAILGPTVVTKAPKAILELVHKLAPEYRVDPQLVLAIMKNESNFDPAALSPKNAMGLMQLIPETAARFDIKNPYDPKQNIRGGLAYLRWLLAYFEGDVTLVAAAYNAGEGTVERYRGVPPYLETRAYVRRVIAAIGNASLPFDSTVSRPSPQLRMIQEASILR